MRNVNHYKQKIFQVETIQPALRVWRLLGKKIAFTNGCFDILHRGHIASLQQAASEADVLIVGMNSDASTRNLKGPDRPVNDESARMIVMASLEIVDGVILFNDPTPLALIELIQPDVLVKGGDYTLDQIVGAQETMARGGRVVINPIVEGFSTTGILERIQKLG